VRLVRGGAAAYRLKRGSAFRLKRDEEDEPSSEDEERLTHLTQRRGGGGSVSFRLKRPSSFRLRKRFMPAFLFDLFDEQGRARETPRWQNLQSKRGTSFRL